MCCVSLACIFIIGLLYYQLAIKNLISYDTTDGFVQGYRISIYTTVMS